MLTHLSLRRLLERWNEEVLTISDLASTTITAQMHDRRWIGSPPATPAELTAWERTTGLSLPPSYRAFAQVSDGWPLVGFDYGAVRPIAKIGWVRDLEPGLLQAWEDSFDEDDAGGDDAAGELRDDEVALLRRCLLLNDGSDRFLMDPGHIGADGEWTTWDFTDWYPGAANRAPSSRAGLEKHYASFVRFEAPDSVSRTEIADLVEQAYRRSLGGDEVGDVFEQAQDYGDLRAEVLDVQVQVLRDDQGAIGRVESFEPPVGEPDPVLRYELWPMLVASLRQRAPWQDSSLDIFLHRLSEPHRVLVRDLVARSEREGGLVADSPTARCSTRRCSRRGSWYGVVVAMRPATSCLRLCLPGGRFHRCTWLPRVCCGTATWHRSWILGGCSAQRELAIDRSLPADGRRAHRGTTVTS